MTKAEEGVSTNAAKNLEETAAVEEKKMRILMDKLKIKLLLKNQNQRIMLKKKLMNNLLKKSKTLKNQNQKN